MRTETVPMPASRLILMACAALSAFSLGACAVGPDFKRPAAEAPPAWSATAAANGASTAQPAADAWWTGFDDPELTSLVERSFAGDLDLQQAALRIAEARAARDVASAQRWPQLAASAGYTTNRLSQSTPTGALFSSLGKTKVPGAPAISIPNPYDQFQLGFDASWEVDLFGRVRRSIEAARADEAVAAEAARDLKLSIAAETARAYFDLRGAQLRRAVSMREIEVAHELTTLARQRRAAGLSSQADVANAEAQALTVEATLPALERQITQDVNALSYLIGREPDAVRAELKADKALPVSPPTLPMGLPADLARRRPDIREAEAHLHGATARVGVAEAALFPQVKLGGPFGLQSSKLQTLTDWASRFYNVGPTINVPVFVGGRLKANVRLADAQAKAAALAYRATVLKALQESENAVAACAADRETTSKLEAAAERGRIARDLARDRYQSGVGSFIDVLDAERSLLQIELNLAQVRAAQAADLVALYKALGGGVG